MRNNTTDDKEDDFLSEEERGVFDQLFTLLAEEDE